jgi:hypothetical protein
MTHIDLDTLVRLREPVANPARPRPRSISRSVKHVVAKLIAWNNG